MADPAEFYELDFKTMMPGDVNDTAHMAPFVQSPAPTAGAAAGNSWWENVISYGVVRAIDNRFGPVALQGNTSPGYFGGANGQTYSNGAAWSQPIAAAGGMSAGTLLLLAAAGLAVYAMTR